MDFVKDSAKLRKNIENITRKLTDGTALSEDQKKQLEDKRSQLRKQFDALLRNYQGWYVSPEGGPG